MNTYHSDMTHRPLFQVTLADGRVVTREEQFAGQLGPAFSPYVFAEDGRLLTIDAERARQQAEAQA